MRRKKEIVLLCVVLISAGLSLGFWLGRNSAQSLRLERDPGLSPQQTVARQQATAEAAPALPRTVLDLNRATLDELCALPGLGPTRAQAILDYRKQHGPFSSVSQLLEIEGIGPKTLDGLLDYLKVEEE